MAQQEGPEIIERLTDLTNGKTYVKILGDDKQLRWHRAFPDGTVNGFASKADIAAAYASNPKVSPAEASAAQKIRSEEERLGEVGGILLAIREELEKSTSKHELIIEGIHAAGTHLRLLEETLPKLFEQLEGQSATAQRLTDVVQELFNDVKAYQRESQELFKAFNAKLAQSDEVVSKIASIAERIETAMAKDKPQAVTEQTAPSTAAPTAEEKPAEEPKPVAEPSRPAPDLGPVRANPNDRAAPPTPRQSQGWMRRIVARVDALPTSVLYGSAAVIALLIAVLAIRNDLLPWSSEPAQQAQTTMPPPAKDQGRKPEPPAPSFDLAQIEAAAANGALHGSKPVVDAFEQHRREAAQAHSQMAQDIGKLAQKLEGMETKLQTPPHTDEEPEEEKHHHQRLPLAELRQVLGW